MESLSQLDDLLQNLQHLTLFLKLSLNSFKLIFENTIIMKILLPFQSITLKGTRTMDFNDIFVENMTYDFQYYVSGQV